ncbi:MAG: cytochrome c peroxidase [Bacteroidota bacterium]
MRIPLRTSCLFSLCTCLALQWQACQKVPESTMCQQQRWFEDADGDGLGNPQKWQQACEAPPAHVSNALDPNDLNPDPNSQIATEAAFDGRIDLDHLANYASQFIPDYIKWDNGSKNPISDAGATLGRVLFYDKKLSINDQVACANCHKQALAFGDNRQLSLGVNGRTSRHAMRLVNSRFAEETHFFWDERAATLEQLSTLPIQDPIEMGFSGDNGAPDLDDLIEKLKGVDYYRELFHFVYGDIDINEKRIQNALSQFIRSIQSFDSPYDEGRRQVADDHQPFPNFSELENQGKSLFLTRPVFGPESIRVGGGAGCQVCHRAPEFDIVLNCRNNGVIETARNPNELELQITRSPSLRNLFNPSGQLNGPLMHNGNFTTIEEVIEHYNSIEFDTKRNNNLDTRLRPMQRGQQLVLSEQEKEALSAFLRTLVGTALYEAEKWSDPFL